MNTLEAYKFHAQHEVRIVVLGSQRFPRKERRPLFPRLCVFVHRANTHYGLTDRARNFGIDITAVQRRIAFARSQGYYRSERTKAALDRLIRKKRNMHYAATG